LEILGPGKCRFFMWLVVRDRCWAADHLARRGLPHPGCCPLCDQDEEDINHLLSTCVFAREFLFFLLRRVGLQVLTPQPDETSFDDWWDRSSNAVAAPLRKGLNSIILGACTLWNIRNRCVFDAESPNLARALLLAGEELLYWALAGARGINNSLPKGWMRVNFLVEVAFFVCQRLVCLDIVMWVGVPCMGSYPIFSS
jgi:hypothetical protein